MDKGWINFGLAFILDNLWTWTKFGWAKEWLRELMPSGQRESGGGIHTT